MTLNDQLSFLRTINENMQAAENCACNAHRLWLESGKQVDAIRAEKLMDENLLRAKILLDQLAKARGIK